MVAHKGGATNLKVGGGVKALKDGGVNPVKILKFEKGGSVCLPRPQLLWWHRPWESHSRDTNENGPNLQRFK